MFLFVTFGDLEIYLFLVLVSVFSLYTGEWEAFCYGFLDWTGDFKDGEGLS